MRIGSSAGLLRTCLYLGALIAAGANAHFFQYGATTTGLHALAVFLLVITGLLVLVTLVEAYEQKHYRMDPPDPIEAIKFRMEQLELKPSDLAKILGGRSRVSEVLNKKRKLTVEMMRSLRKHLAIPAESLLA